MDCCTSVRRVSELSSRASTDTIADMTDLPQIWYGMTSNPVFSIARDVALPRGTKSETHLAWMLLAAENMRKHVPEEEKTALIAGRRAFNYRKMRLLLENPQTRHLDSTLAILALAGSAENRLGSVTLARKHLRAVLHLLTEKDGFQSLQSLTGSTGLEIMNALYQVGFPLILNNLTTLENTFDTTATRLRQMYAWNVRMRDTVLQAQILRDEPALVQSGPATDYDYTAIPKGPGYWEALRQTLGPSSIISECLRPTFRNLPETATRCRIGSLYCLNSVLFNLQQDENTAIHFLNDLAYIVSNSYNLTAPDKTEKEIWLRNLHIATALPATIAHCAMRHGQWLDEAWRPPALRTWESLEFVEIVMLMPSSSRHSLLSLMHSWLTSDECGLNHQDVPVELELEEIKKAIMLKWMTNNSIGV